MSYTEDSTWKTPKGVVTSTQQPHDDSLSGRGQEKNSSQFTTVLPLPIPSMSVDIDLVQFALFSAIFVLGVFLWLCVLCRCQKKLGVISKAYKWSLLLITITEISLIPLLICASMVHKHLCFKHLDCEVLVIFPATTSLCGLCFHLLVVLEKKTCHGCCNCCHCCDNCCCQIGRVLITLTLWGGFTVFFSIVLPNSVICSIISCVLVGLILAVSFYVHMVILRSYKTTTQRYNTADIYLFRLAFLIVVIACAPFATWLVVLIGQGGDMVISAYLTGVCVFSLRMLTGSLLCIWMHSSRPINISHLPKDLAQGDVNSEDANIENAQNGDATSGDAYSQTGAYHETSA